MYEKVYFRMHKGTKIKKAVISKNMDIKKCKFLYVHASVMSGLSGEKRNMLFQIYTLNNCYFSTCSVRLRLKDVLTFCWYCYELLHCSCVIMEQIFALPAHLLMSFGMLAQNWGSVDKPISSASLWSGKTSYSSIKPFVIYCQNLKCSFPLYISQA